MCVLAYGLYVLLSLFGKILKAAAACCIRLPTLEGLEDRLGLLLSLCVGKVLCDLSVQIICLTDLDFFKGIQNIQLCDGNGCESVQV